MLPRINIGADVRGESSIMTGVDVWGESSIMTGTHAASGWRIHCGVEVTELSTNKQHSLSLYQRWCSSCTSDRVFVIVYV
jgi:hypothetical protein